LPRDNQLPTEKKMTEVYCYGS